MAFLVYKYLCLVIIENFVKFFFVWNQKDMAKVEV